MNKEIIDITDLPAGAREVVKMVVDQMRAKNNADEPPAPEKWTAKEVVDRSLIRWNLMGWELPDNGVDKIKAYLMLLTCAHWANDGEKVSAIFHQWNWNYGGTVLPIPAPFKNKDAYDKFLSIEGIEPFLKTFFGIND